ncbi:MAG: DUF4394 domain-containing protein [Ignavibacteria bacterium]|nr:DUF4394 domain-containing protein [Ignavibacteria bacterium]
MKKSIFTFCGAIILMIAISSCNKDMDVITSSSSTSETNQINDPRGFAGSDNEIYLLANGTRLDKFNLSNLDGSSPSSSNSAFFTGLQPGETILGIDFRPATGQMYGLGSTSRIYVINPITGASRMIGTGPFTPALSGTLAGFDFNPTVDRIRIVTNTGQNFRVNPETGATVATDGSINAQSKTQISAVAYTNNFAGSTSTALYDIDIISKTLYKQDPPNIGTLVSVGPLNLNIEGEGGFDIGPTGLALGIYKVNNVPTMFEVNLNTGAVNVVATFPGTEFNALAIYTSSVAYATTSTNQLLIFGLEGNSTIAKTITGLSSGETILGLDMRPLNGQLYALGSNSNIYTINSANGAATLAYNINPPIPGTTFGFDFNPVVDRIRIISNTGANRRFNPNDGSVIVDGSINPGSPEVTSAAYSNNFAGTTSTTLFAINHINNKLYQVIPPNAGTLVDITGLTLNVPAVNGFDFGGKSNNAYVVLHSDSRSSLHRINTTTGQHTQTRFIGNDVITGFAIGLGF